MYTNPANPTPRQRRSDSNRARILDAARTIILEKGLDGLSMRGLAEAVDYSPSALYKYFTNKEQILVAIRDEGWELANAMMATAASAPYLPPPQRLVESGKAFLKFAETYPDHFELMFNSPDLPMKGPENVSSDPNFKGLIDTVDDGIRDGYFQIPEGYTPLLMAFEIWITSHGMAMLKKTRMRGNRQGFDELCEKLIELYVGSFTIKK